MLGKHVSTLSFPVDRPRIPKFITSQQALLLGFFSTISNCQQLSKGFVLKLKEKEKQISDQAYGGIFPRTSKV